MKKPQLRIYRSFVKKQTCDACLQHATVHQKRVKAMRSFFVWSGLCMLLLTANSIIDYIPIATIVIGLVLECIFE